MFKIKKGTLFILGILVVLTALEYVFAYHNVGYGIIMALFLTLGIYIIISIPETETPVLRAAESLALLPLYVLFTASLPWFFVDPTYLIPAIYSIILALVFWHIYYKEISFEELGFIKDKWVFYCIFGLVIGVSTGTIEYFVLRPPPSAPFFQAFVLLRDFTYMTLFVGLGEELLFRSVIQKDLENVFGENIGLWTASVIFGIMHLTWRSPTELVFASLAGYLMGYLYDKTGSLAAPILLHGMNNTMLVGILPYIFG